MKKDNKNNNKKKKLIFYAVLLAFCFVLYHTLDLSGSDLVNAAPENRALAVLFVLAAYALKSLTVFFPLPVLYLVSSALFPLPAALAVNAAGLLVAAAVPYFIGRIQKTDLFEDRISPETLAVIQNLEMDNSFLYTLLLRNCHVAYDPLSMYLGSRSIGVPGYFFGTLAATGPSMAAITLIGDNIFSSESPYFIPALLCLLAYMIITFVICHCVLEKNYPEQYSYLRNMIHGKIRVMFHKK